jgi:SAM-dependent methyltransferase
MDKPSHMGTTKNDAIAPFSADITSNRGYLYTTNAPLSSCYANERMTTAMLAQVDMRDKRVIDIGCGDGTFTIELFDRGKPRSMTGIDPCAEAITMAEQKKEEREIEFVAKGAYDLPWNTDSFDIACIRGVLHHLERPIDALREAFRVAPLILVVEPNGYNPGLKVLEKVSTYHVQHEEKSYAASRLNRWVTMLGGLIIAREWIGFVPVFCPDWFARVLKSVEPIIERVPILNRFCCAQYVFTARRR